MLGQLKVVVGSLIRYCEVSPCFNEFFPKHEDRLALEHGGPGRFDLARDLLQELVVRRRRRAGRRCRGWRWRAFGRRCGRGLLGVGQLKARGRERQTQRLRKRRRPSSASRLRPPSRPTAWRLSGGAISDSTRAHARDGANTPRARQAHNAEAECNSCSGASLYSHQLEGSRHRELRPPRMLRPTGRRLQRDDPAVVLAVLQPAQEVEELAVVALRGELRIRPA